MSSKNYLDKNGLTYFWGKVQNEISPKANTSDVLTKTNTTSYTPTANYHPATKKYVDDKGFVDLNDVFVIACSVDGSNNHVVDKTWTEITTAINAGKDVYIKIFNCYLYPLTGFEASGSTQGSASFYAPMTWGDGTLENYTITVWDTTFSGNTHSPWEDNTGTSPVLYFDVSYSNDTYTIGSGVTATELYSLINGGAVVILKYGGLYYHLSQYYDMDEITLYFVSDNGFSFEEFTVTDRLDTTTITYTYESEPLIKAGTGDSAVIINDYYAVPPCIASGNGALSEGGATEASGAVSHAEGRMTVAYGNYSHAENQHAYAYGVGSHAEGGTLSGNITISGAANATTYTITGSPIIYGTAAEMALYVMIMYGVNYYRPVSVTVADNIITSFTLESTLDAANALTNASGKLYFCTVAKGKGSHAECGATYAHADYSHSEGKQTHASGTNSHSEGLLTVAASANQHVQGKNNIVDSAGTYAHIVGNGTSSSARSNAHTLDWNGNGWYAGKLTVGTAPTNNMDVATKQYVDTAVSGASSSLMLTATVDNTTVTFTGATPSEVYNAASGGALVQATVPLVWGDGIFDLKEYNYDSSGGDYYFIFSNVTSDMGRPQNRLVQCSLSTGSVTSWTGSLQESCLVGASIFEDVTGVFIDDTTLANNQILRYDANYGSFVNANTPAIKSGTGENSVIVGTIEDDSSAATYTLYLTGGDNKSRVYSYTTQDTLPSTIKAGSYVECERSSNDIRRALIDSIDKTNFSITLSDTFNTLSNKEVKIYCKYANTAVGDYSFAEGRWTRAIGGHAEGHSTLAASTSHSEGLRSAATGAWSHAEGYETYANEDACHSEGYKTIASSVYQHVQGKYNIEDISSIYAHIVGNGTDSDTRSNAHTLDWSGNSWYAGKVSAGTVASPASVTNANDLTTKAYVDNALSGVTTNLAGLTDTTVSSPSNGQILIYNSTTSKWENATSPYQTQAQVNALIAAALAEYGDGDTATYGYTDGNEVNY